jgi:DNA-binding LacI/PurR family transcriptional regulator
MKAALMTKETPSSKPATIYDVAERAGVSHITVSRVVNGKQNVSPDTRERVQKAMLELQYTPNPIAQTLQTRRSRTIELITTNPYGSNVSAITAISAVAHANDHQFSILLTTAEDLPGILQAIPNRMVAGSILYAQDITFDDTAVKRIIKRYPLVYMGGKLQSGLSSVVYDQKLATEQAVQYLIDLGHRRIAFISGDLEMLDGLNRHETYFQTMAKNHLPVGPIAYGDFSAKSGAHAAEALLKQGETFTAVFASSDAMAAAAIHALRQAGLRVPEDVSVIGYDDFNVAPYLSPPLTTVTNDSAILGRMTAEYLFELMQNPDMPRQQRVLMPELIIRESVKPIPQP